MYRPPPKPPLFPTTPPSRPPPAGLDAGDERGVPALLAERVGCKVPATRRLRQQVDGATPHAPHCTAPARSEEHTSELQSRQYLVCRLLLEKKNKKHHSISAC